MKRGGGRPKAGCWAISMIPKSTIIHYDLDFPLFHLNEYNTNWDQCLCVYCEKIIEGPLLFKACEHGACRSCFLAANHKKAISDTVCIRCSVPIPLETDVTPSGVLQRCIDNLKVKCTLGLLMYFLLCSLLYSY